MHEEGVVCQGHLFAVNCPCAVGRKYLAVVRIGVGRPVLGIYEVSAFEGFALIIFYTSFAHEFRGKLIAFRMRDYKFIVSGVHPFCEGVGDGLRKSARMRRPGHYHLGALLGLELFYGDEVGEALEWVAGGCLHAEYGAAGVADELVDHSLLIVFGLVFETGERTDPDDVAVGAHHRDGFEKMLGLVAVHDYAAFGFELPCSLVDVEDYDVHAEIHGGFLGAQARAKTGVEEDHHQSLVASEFFESETVGFDFECLFDCEVKRAYVCDVSEVVHFSGRFFRGEYLAECIDEAARVGARQAEGWEQAHGVLAGSSGEDTVFEEQALADFRCRAFDLDADHESASTDFGDFITLGGQAAQLFHQIFAFGGGVGYHGLAFKSIDHGNGGYAGKVVTSEGGAEHSFDRRDRWRDEHRAHREAVGYAFGTGDDVGADAGVLVGEEASGAAVARLDFIKYEQCAGGCAEFAQAAHEVVIDHADTCHSLDAFNDHSGKFAGGEKTLRGLDVVERGEDHILSRIEGCLDLGIVSCGYGSGCASVECAVKGEDLAASGVERGEFHRVFVSLGSGVAEKEGIVIVAGDASQSVGEFLLEGVLHGVRVEAQTAYLVGDGRHIERMGVAHGDHGVASVEVKIFRAVGCIDMAAESFDRLDVI